MSEQGATRAVAEFVAQTNLDAIPQNVRDLAVKAIADTVGVIVAGTASDLSRPLREYVEKSRSSGPSRIVALGYRTSAETAALANATLGHALDFDDVVPAIPGHPSAIVVGALLAMPNLDALTGAQMLEAYVIGLEAAAKIGQAIGVGHYNRGWHATGTVATFAAVAALAKVYGLDVATIQRAVGIAASLVSGLQRNFGTMTKPLHSGQAARNATLAVDLASVGWTSNSQILEVRNGFMDLYGTEASDAEMVVSALGNPYVFDDPGVTLKAYPCCYAVHRSIDGVRELLGRPALPNEISEIQALVPTGGLRPLLYSRPSTGLEAKFSLEYGLTVAALDGNVTLASFTPDAITRPAVKDLIERTKVSEDPKCDVGDGTVKVRTPGSMGFVEITVGKTNGESSSVRVYHATGSPQKPSSWETIEAKFEDCARAVGLDSTRARSAFDALRNLTTAKRVADIVSDLN